MNRPAENAIGKRALRKRNPLLHGLTAWGPGLLVMLADTDAGNVVAAAQAGAQWNFRLLPLILALIPALYLVQELAARLGLFTGEGFGSLGAGAFRQGRRAGRAGRPRGRDLWDAGHGNDRLRGRRRTLRRCRATSRFRPTSLALLAVAATGSYRRAEQAALAVGPVRMRLSGRRLEGAAGSRPPWSRDFLHAPLGDSGLPVSRRRHRRRDVQPLDGVLPAGRDGAAPACRTTISRPFAPTPRSGRPSRRSSPAPFWSPRPRRSMPGTGAGASPASGRSARRSPRALGRDNALLVFSLGVLGASFAAAIVASLALSWGVAEVFPTQSTGGAGAVRVCGVSSRFMRRALAAPRRWCASRAIWSG